MMPIYIYDRDSSGMVDKRTGEPMPVPAIFTPPRVHVRGDYKAYSCPITGKVIEGKHAHSENLKRHGCRVLEPGERQDSLNRRAEADRAFEKTVSDVVDKTAAQLG
jgi:hypothetical protein